jgi:surface antigen
VLYGPNGALWSTGTVNHGGAYLVMQGDGNLVLYGPSGALWSSGTPGKLGAYLAVQDDGNLVVYAAGGAVWASNTAVSSSGKPPSTAASISYNPYPSNQCTYYAEERMHQQTGMYMPGFGDAWMWSGKARSRGWTVGTTPAVNSVVVFPKGYNPPYSLTWGHVAWVIGIIPGNKLQVMDYNWNYKGAIVTNHTMVIVPGTQFIYSDR